MNHAKRKQRTPVATLARIVLCLCATLCCSAAAWAGDTPSESSGRIFLKGRTITVSEELAQRSAGRISAQAVADAQPRLYLVHFTSPVLDEWRSAFADAGGTVCGYVPENTLLVRISGSGLAAYPHLSHADYAGLMLDSDKYDPALLRIVNQGPDSVSVNALVMTVPGADTAEISAIITVGGGVIIQESDSSLIATLPIAALRSAAASSLVMYIQQAGEMADKMDNAPQILFRPDRRDTQAWTSWDTSAAFTGQGSCIHIFDSSIHPAHPAIAGRVAVNPNSTASAGTGTGHGTGVASVAAGLDTTIAPAFMPAPYRGVSYQSNIYFSSHAGFMGLANQINLRTAVDNGCWVHNMSFGTINQTDGDYDAAAYNIDVHSRNFPESVVVTAGGNEGFDAVNNGIIMTSLSDLAVSKNSIAVCSASNAADTAANQSVSLFSSRGPTADGRVKPDVCAPGDQVLVANAGAGAAAPYTRVSGTSAAAPVVAGLANLLRRQLTDSTGATPSAALIKAILVNGATPIRSSLGGAVLNRDHNPLAGALQSQGAFHQGWGLVNGVNALNADNAVSRVFSDREIALRNNEEAVFSFTVTDTSAPLKLTLAWTDPPAFPGAAKTLVNDLDLELSGPGGALSLGNDFQSLGVADHVNNVENVFIDAPAAGLYTVRVRGFNVPAASQEFALVAAAAPGNAFSLARTTPFAAVIDSPVDSSVVNGALDIRGTASGDPAQFGNYQLTWGRGATPAGWAVIATGANQVRNGTLGMWDTAGMTDGVYTLRLAVFRTGSGIPVADNRVRVFVRAADTADWSAIPLGPVPVPGDLRSLAVGRDGAPFLVADTAGNRILRFDGAGALVSSASTFYDRVDDAVHTFSGPDRIFFEDQLSRNEVIPFGAFFAIFIDDLLWTPGTPVFGILDTGNNRLVLHTPDADAGPGRFEIVDFPVAFTNPQTVIGMSGGDGRVFSTEGGFRVHQSAFMDLSIECRLRTAHCRLAHVSDIGNPLSALGVIAAAPGRAGNAFLLHQDPADAARRAISLFTNTNTMLRTISADNATGAVFDADEMIRLISDHDLKRAYTLGRSRIQVFDELGGFLMSLPLPAPAPGSNPYTDFAMDANGNIYVLDSSNRRILTLNFNDFLWPKVNVTVRAPLRSGIKSSDPVEQSSLGVPFTLEASYGEETLSVTQNSSLATLTLPVYRNLPVELVLRTDSYVQEPVTVIPDADVAPFTLQTCTVGATTDACLFAGNPQFQSPDNRRLSFRGDISGGAPDFFDRSGSVIYDSDHIAWHIGTHDLSSESKSDPANQALFNRADLNGDGELVYAEDMMSFLNILSLGCNETVCGDICIPLDGALNATTPIAADTLRCGVRDTACNAARCLENAGVPGRPPLSWRDADVNGDGLVSLLDALPITGPCQGKILPDSECDEDLFWAADITNDSQINRDDLAALLRIAPYNCNHTRCGNLCVISQHYLDRHPDGRCGVNDPDCNAHCMRRQDGSIVSWIDADITNTSDSHPYAIDGADYDALWSQFVTNRNWDAETQSADINEDGFVDLADYSLMDQSLFCDQPSNCDPEFCLLIDPGQARTPPCATLPLFFNPGSPGVPPACARSLCAASFQSGRFLTFDDTDLNRDEWVDLNDVLVFRGTLFRGFGPSARSGFNTMDYSRDRIVDVTDAAAMIAGSDRCVNLFGEHRTKCELCDDAAGPPIDDCPY